MCECGIEIPERHVPEVREIRDEDYELGQYLVRELVAVPRAAEPLPGFVPFTEVGWALTRADGVGEKLEWRTVAMDFYLDVMRDLREQVYH